MDLEKIDKESSIIIDSELANSGDAKILAKAKASWEAAEDLVVAYEAKQGRQAVKITNTSKQNVLGYDIESKSADGREVRHIEVKNKMAKGKKFGYVQLTPNETNTFKTDVNFWLYLIEGDCTDDKTSINIVEVDRETLIKQQIPKDVVRFSALRGLLRKKMR
jgi:hypothetical protein